MKKSGKIKEKVEPIDFSGCEAFQGLRLQHQQFVLEYVKDFNGARAAEETKFSKKTARSIASELLTRPDIQTALAEVLHVIHRRGAVADAQELREFWTAILRGDIGEVCTWNDGGLSFNSTSVGMSKAKRRLIKKISVKEKTSQKGDFNEVQTSVELHDPLKASELIARDLGLIKDGKNITVKEGGVVLVID